MVRLVSFFFLLDFVVLSHCAFSAGKAVPCWFGHLWEYFWFLWIALIVLILKAVEVIVLCVAWILFVWYCWWGVSWASLNLAVCFDWLTVTASDSSFFFLSFLLPAFFSHIRMKWLGCKHCVCTIASWYFLFVNGFLGASILRFVSSMVQRRRLNSSVQNGDYTD